MGYVAIILMIYALCIGLVALAARLYGVLNQGYWVRMGVIWGPFALPFLFLAKRKGGVSAVR